MVSARGARNESWVLEVGSTITSSRSKVFPSLWTARRTGRLVHGSCRRVFKLSAVETKSGGAGPPRGGWWVGNRR